MDGSAAPAAVRDDDAPVLPSSADDDAPFESIRPRRSSSPTAPVLSGSGRFVGSPESNSKVTTDVGQLSLKRSNTQSRLKAAAGGNDALAAGSEALCKWLMGTSKEIITGPSRVDGIHYSFLSTATTSQAVDRVVQSLRYASSRKIIMRGLLRAAGLICDDVLVTSSRATQFKATAGAEFSENLCDLYFPDHEDRMFDEAMLHAAVLLFVNFDAVEDNGELEAQAVEDYGAVIRWVLQRSKAKNFVSLASLAVALCALLYGSGLGAVNWRLAQELRRLVDVYRVSYSSYDDAVSTLSDLHDTLLGSSYQCCRAAVNDLFPRIQRNLESVSAASRMATLLHRAMVEVRETFEWFIESVEEDFHELRRQESRQRQTIDAQFDAFADDIRDTIRKHKEIAVFHQAWSTFFAVLEDEENEHRRRVLKEMRFESDFLEVQILSFIRCPHHVIHRDIWEDVLWDVKGLDVQERRVRVERLEKQEQRERAALSTAATIDRQSLSISNPFDEYYLEDAERRSMTRLQKEAAAGSTTASSSLCPSTSFSRAGDGSSNSLLRVQESSSTGGNGMIVVPPRPSSPPAATRYIVGSSKCVVSTPSPARFGKLKLVESDARTVAGEEEAARDHIACEEGVLRAGFYRHVKSVCFEKRFDWSLGGDSALGFEQLPLLRSRDFFSATTGVGKQPDRHLPAHMRTPQPGAPSSVSLPRVSPDRRGNVSPQQATGGLRPTSSVGPGFSLRAESRGVGLLLPGAVQGSPPPAPPPQAPSALQFMRGIYSSSLRPTSTARTPAATNPHQLQYQPSPTAGGASSARLGSSCNRADHLSRSGTAVSPAGSPRPAARVLSDLEDEFFGARSRRTAKYGKGGALLPTLPRHGVVENEGGGGGL